ncbi:hypothetical protein Gpo141_00007326 [Globisporangium polare]
MLQFNLVHPSPGVRLVQSGGYGGESESRVSARSSGRQAVLPMDLILSKCVRRVCWAIIVGIQLFHVASLCCLAFIYSQLNVRDSLLWLFSTVYLFSSTNAFLESYYVLLTMSYALFALIFGLLLLEMLFYSCRYRELAYGKRKRVRIKSKSSRVCCARLTRYTSRMLSSWNRLFGIRGRYFAFSLMAQEVVEIALQTSQAHASSKFVSNLALNQSYGLLICGNCMSTILVHRWLHDDSVFSRLVCVLIDLVLDFVWGIVLPFVLFYPRLVEYFTNGNEEGLTTSAELIREEIEHLLILSAKSYVWSFFPFFSTVWNIIKLKRVLAQSIPLDATTVTLKVLAQRKQTERVLSWQKKFVLMKFLPRAHHYFNRAVLLYGLFVLCVSIHASGVFRHREDTPFLCVHQVYPWFASRKSCSMRQIDCAEASMSGTSGEITAAMEFFNADSLTNLAIQRCPQLAIPPALHRFTHLRILLVTDSNVTSWPANASVELLPALVTLKLYSLRFESVPFGILRQPQSMEWISVLRTDINQFAQRIGAGWNTVKYFYCDSCGLTSIPRFMYSMSNLIEFSACNNSIASLPEDFFSRRSMTVLFFDGNPLQSLPGTLWQPSLFDLYIQSTNVSVLTSWGDTSLSTSLAIHASGSPLCQEGRAVEKYANISDKIICKGEVLSFG